MHHASVTEQGKWRTFTVPTRALNALTTVSDAQCERQTRAQCCSPCTHSMRNQRQALQRKTNRKQARQRTNNSTSRACRRAHAVCQRANKFKQQLPQRAAGVDCSESTQRQQTSDTKRHSAHNSAELVTHARAHAGCAAAQAQGVTSQNTRDSKNGVQNRTALAAQRNSDTKKNSVEIEHTGCHRQAACAHSARGAGAAAPWRTYDTGAHTTAQHSTEQQQTERSICWLRVQQPPPAQPPQAT